MQCNMHQMPHSVQSYEFFKLPASATRYTVDLLTFMVTGLSLLEDTIILQHKSLIINLKQSVQEIIRK